MTDAVLETLQKYRRCITAWQDCHWLMIQHSRNWSPAKSVSHCILQMLHLQITTNSIHRVRTLSQLCTVPLIGGNRKYVYSLIAWHLFLRLAEVHYPSKDCQIFRIENKTSRDANSSPWKADSLLCTFLSRGCVFGRWREDLTVMGQAQNLFELLSGRRCLLTSLGVSLNKNDDDNLVFVLMFLVIFLLSLHHI